MTAALAHPAMALHPQAVVATLRERQPALAAVGLSFLAFFVVTLCLPLFDARTLDGVSVWAKPSKFFLSAGVFILTSAWFFGYVRPDRRDAPMLRGGVWLLIGTASFELAYITLQAARGEPSHFNRSDPLHGALYATMGAAALAMLATKAPLALEIWRRPAVGLDPTIRFAAALGIALTIGLGALSGLYMGQNLAGGHTVGAVGGAAPLLGWNRAGGDLRVAHFFGMHAEQILPLVAVVGSAAFTRVWARRLVVGSGVALAAVTVAVFVQAVMGRPFPLG